MSTKLPEKVAFFLTKTRILMLGAEMGLGFQFELPFQEGFVSQASGLRWAHLCALALMLVTIVIIIFPMMLDIIVFRGQAALATQACANLAVEVSLAIFASSLGLSVAGAAWETAGPGLASAVGALFFLASTGFWYVYPCRRRMRSKHRSRQQLLPLPLKKAMETPLETRLRDVLTEARIILPGAQAMLGFQMVAFLTHAFSHLPRSSQWAHLGATLFLLAAIVLLMAPPAFHRIAEAGEETERLHSFSQNVVFIAAIPFACSLVCDFYVATRMVSNNSKGSLVAALVLLGLCAGCWYGLPYLYRWRNPNAQPGLNGR